MEGTDNRYIAGLGVFDPRLMDQPLVQDQQAAGYFDPVTLSMIATTVIKGAGNLIKKKKEEKENQQLQDQKEQQQEQQRLKDLIEDVKAKDLAAKRKKAFLIGFGLLVTVLLIVLIILALRANKRVQGALKG